MVGMEGMILCVALLGMGGDAKAEVRLPVGESGQVDATRLVASWAEKLGLELGPLGEPVRLPVQGLAGALSRTLLAETLGPDFAIEVGPRELVVSLDPAAMTPERLPALRARVRELAEKVRDGSASRARYGMTAFASYRPNDPSRPTVCLVHGINSSAGGFVHMIGPLEQAGLGVVAYEFPFNQDLDATAPAFGRDWAAFRKDAGETRPWAILAHSMGALIARHYVEGPGYVGDVSDLVLIAPPNRGSAVAKAQSLLQLIQGAQGVKGRKAGTLAHLSDGLGAAADDLSPGSAFLKAINARPRREGVRYHILAGDAGFLSSSARARLDAQLGVAARSGGLLGGLTRLAAGDVSAQLDELTDGLGDGCVSVASTRLAGVADHETIHANHVELIRGPLLYPDPGPVACMPFVLKRLAALKPAGR
jgi:pimeloyl-ACP methyl ester carboxylesterase